MKNGFFNLSAFCVSMVNSFYHREHRVIQGRKLSVLRQQFRELFIET